MNFLSRALNYIKGNKVKHLLIFLLFTAVFAVTISVLIIYMSYSKQLNVLQTGLRSSVTLDGIKVSDRYMNAGARTSVFREDAEIFIDSEYVKSFNFNDYMYVSYVDDLKKYIIDQERYEKELKKAEDTRAYDEEMYELFYGTDAALIVRGDTEYDFAFTVNGYKLVEGRHIKPEDGENSVCLISKQVAELNNLNIGDRFRVEISRFGMKFDMEIVGLFDIPDGAYMEGFGDSPQEMIFAPEGMQAKEEKRVGRESAYSNVTVYLDSAEDTDAFVEEVKGKMNIRNVYDAHIGNKSYEIPEEMAGLSYTEVADYYDEGHWYDIQIDREWYDMVGEPLVKVTSLMEVICIAIIIVTLLIQVLLAVLLISGRQKEIGILVSLGEKKSKIIAQFLAEDFIKLVVAVCMGVLIGILIGVTSISYLSSDVYEYAADDSRAELEQLNHEYYETEESFSDMSDSENSAVVNLSGRHSLRMRVHPNITPEISPEAIVIYCILAFGLMIISVLIEGVYILRLSPVKLLMGKK